MTPEEEAIASGARGLEAMSWPTPLLMRRIAGEIQRLVAVHGENLGHVILNVITTPRVEEWVGGVARVQGWATAQLIREAGECSDGIVWPGHRESMADVFAAGGSVYFARVLRQAPGPWQIFLVVHYTQGEEAASAIVPFTVLTTPRLSVS